MTNFDPNNPNRQGRPQNWPAKPQYQNQQFPHQMQQFPAGPPSKNDNKNKNLLISVIAASVLLIVILVGVALVSNKKPVEVSTLNSSNNVSNSGNSSSNPVTTSDSSSSSNNSNDSAPKVGDCLTSILTNPKIVGCDSGQASVKVSAVVPVNKQCPSDTFMQTLESSNNTCFEAYFSAQHCYVGVNDGGSLGLIGPASCSSPGATEVYKTFNNTVNGKVCAPYADENGNFKALIFKNAQVVICHA